MYIYSIYISASIDYPYTYSPYLLHPPLPPPTFKQPIPTLGDQRKKPSDVLPRTPFPIHANAERGHPHSQCGGSGQFITGSGFDIQKQRIWPLKNQAGLGFIIIKACLLIFFTIKKIVFFRK